MLAQADANLGSHSISPPRIKHDKGFSKSSTKLPVEVRAGEACKTFPSASGFWRCLKIIVSENISRQHQQSKNYMKDSNCLVTPHLWFLDSASTPIGWQNVEVTAKNTGMFLLFSSRVAGKCSFGVIESQLHFTLINQPLANQCGRPWWIWSPAHPPRLHHRASICFSSLFPTPRCVLSCHPGLRASSVPTLADGAEGLRSPASSLRSHRSAQSSARDKSIQPHQRFLSVPIFQHFFNDCWSFLCNFLLRFVSHSKQTNCKIGISLIFLFWWSVKCAVCISQVQVEGNVKYIGPGQGM